MNKTSVIISISLTNNNVLVNLTDLHGQNLHFLSAGLTTSTKGTKKTTAISLKNLANKIQSLLNTNSVHIKIKGLSKYKRLFLKLILKFSDLRVLSFHDLTALPHNGCKQPKLRRV